MQSKQVLGEARSGKTCVPVVLCLAVLGIVIIPSFAARGRGALRENASQEFKKVNLSVQDARPLAKAIVVLEAQYGWIITYEDPRYVYADDVDDVTEKVRRDLDKYPKGEAPKVLVPKGGELSFEYDVLSQTNLPRDPGAVVQRLLAAQAASGLSGTFRMEKRDEFIHVIPTAIKGRLGKLMPHKSVLDAVITLPAKERTGLQTLEALCSAVSKATQMRVVVGAVPFGLFLQHKDQQGVAGQKAREFLVQLLESIAKGKKLSWQLLYDPGMKIYALNIHVV